VALVRKVAAYYDQLNRDQTFRAELRQLFRALSFPQFQPDARRQRMQPYPDEAAEILAAFAERWPLGTAGPADLWASHILATHDEGFCELVIRGGSWAGEMFPTVTPPALPSLRLDARYLSGASLDDWIREQVTIFENDLRRQRDRIIRDAEAAFQPVPPRHQDRDITRLARRLYRAIIQGWSDARIADAEAADLADSDRPPYTDPESIRRSILRFAGDLGITWPKGARSTFRRSRPIFTSTDF